MPIYTSHYCHTKKEPITYQARSYEEYKEIERIRGEESEEGLKAFVLFVIIVGLGVMFWSRISNDNDFGKYNMFIYTFNIIGFLIFGIFPIIYVLYWIFK